jgi:glycosyltransferase involved in cell wall biosynthesis
MGTPVIATRIFGIPELIQHRITGTLVSPDAPEELADAICLAYKEPMRLESMRVAGREAVSTAFQRTRCTKQLIALWGQALDCSTSRK